LNLPLHEVIEGESSINTRGDVHLI
jgi:hypothetical protein